MAQSWPWPKDPDEVLDYDINWSDQMTLDADTIETSSWTLPTGITKDSDSNTTTRTKVTLSGGTAGQAYLLTNTIVTAGDRTFERTVKIKVKDR